MSSSKKRQLATGNKNKKGAVSSSSLVKISGQRRSRDYEVDPVLAAQRSQKWHDMPYAALQLIALYNCKTAYNAIVLGLVYSRFDDTVANYLPADVWRRFYHHVVNVHYQIPEEQIAEAKLPTPEKLEQYAHASRYWQLLIDDARALRETFRGVENMPDSWSVHALGTVADWNGVKLESGRVTGVDLCEKFLRGSVDLTKLPTGLLKIVLNGTQLPGSVVDLTGVVDLTQLPEGLQFLCFDDVKLPGSIDLTQLPTGLRELVLLGSRLSGSVDLTQLPAGLQYLSLRNNNLGGCIDLTHLPAGLKALDLDENELSGSVDLTWLPASLQRLYLNCNRLSGSVDLTHLPAALQKLHLDSNKLEGSIDLTWLPESMRKLDLRWNYLCGSINLTQLPKRMRKLHLRYNNFSKSTSVNNKKCEVHVDRTVQMKKNFGYSLYDDSYSDEDDSGADKTGWRDDSPDEDDDEIPDYRFYSDDDYDVDGNRIEYP